MNYNWILVGFFGFTAIIVGAMSGHGPSNNLDVAQVHLLQTATRYQIWHTLALAMATFLVTQHNIKWFRFASYGFIIGNILFCGSLYIVAFLKIGQFVYITPFGGMSLIISWFLIMVGGIQLARKKS